MIITITFENGNVQYVEGLPDGWTYLVEDNDTNGFDIGVWKGEVEDEDEQYPLGGPSPVNDLGY